MKKKLLTFVGAALLALTMGACTPKTSPSSTPGGDTQVVTKYTVTFYVDGERFATKKVNEGEHITGVTNPTKEGYKFVGWLEGETLIDLETYVVTKDTRLDASFELDEGDVLSVDDVKEQGKSYYLVMGWWEDSDSETGTSGLNKQNVRAFYANLIKYLKATGATDANIANMQFRNYSSPDVASLGELLRSTETGADVDIVIGVGGNINEDPAVTGSAGANVPLYNSNNNDYKFKTTMGTKNANRTVACLQYASELGARVYTWLRDTDAGKAAFLRELTDAEIEESLTPETINLAVTVHGDTNITTTLTDKNTAIEMPVITVQNGYAFRGFATTENATAVQLKAAKNAVLKYDDVKGLVAAGANTLDLYPVISEVDLVVYVQLNSGLKEAEAKLLESRFSATLTDQSILVETVSGNAAAFTKAITDAGNVDVAIGGGNPVNSHTAHAQGPAATAGAKHFADDARRICIESTVSADHLTLAKTFYDFVIADAAKLTVKAAFWPEGKSNKIWVTTEEKDAMMAGMNAKLSTLMGVANAEALLATYNVELAGEMMEAADHAAGTYAAASVTYGADLIIGCGSNINEQVGYIGVENKTISNDAHTFVEATGRFVAIPHDNYLTRDIYNNYFVLPTA